MKTRRGKDPTTYSTKSDVEDGLLGVEELIDRAAAVVGPECSRGAKGAGINRLGTRGDGGGDILRGRRYVSKSAKGRNRKGPTLRE